jgi:hypothetical protein
MSDADATQMMTDYSGLPAAPSRSPAPWPLLVVAGVVIAVPLLYLTWIIVLLVLFGLFAPPL